MLVRELTRHRRARLIPAASPAEVSEPVVNQTLTMNRGRSLGAEFGVTDVGILLIGGCDAMAKNDAPTIFGRILRRA